MARKKKAPVAKPAPTQPDTQTMSDDRVLDYAKSLLVEDDLEKEPPPDPEKLARLADQDMRFIEKQALLNFFKEQVPDLEYQDRAPFWAIATLDAYFCTAQFGIAEHRSALDVLDLVRHDPELQLAVAGAYHMQAAAFELMDVILTWPKKEESNE